MKVLLLGDTHLRYKGPSSRVDDFFQTQLAKFVQVLDIYKEFGCELLLQAGDLFDNPKPPNYLMGTYITLLKQRDVVIHNVLGQHDVAMHNLSSASRSAVNVFRSAGVLKTLGGEPADIGGILFYGCSWKEPVPTPQKNRRAILAIHEMIADKPLFPGHEPIRPRSFIHAHSGYELVLCGDYHYRFQAEEEGRKIVNCGALVRLNTKDTDLELKPSVAIYDTETREIIWRELKYLDSDLVFRVKSKEQGGKDSSLVEFVERLRGQMGVTVSFRDNLQRYFDENSTEDGVRIEIFSALEEVGQKK